MHKSSDLFRNNVRRILKDLGWTQKKLADQAGLQSSGLNDYLTGKHDPGLNVIDQIASALGMNAAELLSDPNKSSIKPNVIEPDPAYALEIIARAIGELLPARTLVKKEPIIIEGGNTGDRKVIVDFLGDAGTSSAELEQIRERIENLVGKRRHKVDRGSTGSGK